MRIAVIADTHGKLPPSVQSDIAQADEIWHLGDVGPGVEGQLLALGRPLEIVLGNNDFGETWPLRKLIDRAGHTFLLIHIPPHHPGGADFLLHGHTHVPRDEKIGGTRILNPGTVGKPNKGAPPSYAWLEVTPGLVNWQICLI